MRRGLFLADGVSDLPLALHIETLCRGFGSEIAITRFPADRLATRTIHGRITAVLAEDPEFDIIFVHRDSESLDPEPRYGEVVAARALIDFEGPVVAVVIVRMTEAWLLLDEDEIRRVAGKPGGRRRLDLPSVREAERIADPKSVLREALAEASELSGRRLKLFRGQFGTHRARLIENLNLDGRPSELLAVQRLRQEVVFGVNSLSGPRAV